MAAKNKNSTPNEFSSTLLFVSIKKNKFICGHLGDGVIAYVYKDKLQVLSIPESGEFANETYFVTSFNYVEKFKLIKGYVDAIDAFVLMSDGTSNSLYDKRKSTVSPVVSNILNWLDHYTIAEVNDALKTNFETVIRAKTRDDCSIAFVKRKRRL